MFELILGGIMAVVSSPWFMPLLTWILGIWSGQLPLVQRAWGAIMGVRKQMDQLEEVLDTVDAVLKANGVIPADAPRLEAAQVKAVMAGHVSAEALAKSQKAKMAVLK